MKRYRTVVHLSNLSIEFNDPLCLTKDILKGQSLREYHSSYLLIEEWNRIRLEIIDALRLPVLSLAQRYGNRF